MRKNHLLRFGCAITLVWVVVGCDILPGDAEYLEPQFIYGCMDAEADYHCINPDYFDDTTYTHLGNGEALENIALGSRFEMMYGEPLASSAGGDGGVNDYRDKIWSTLVVSAAGERISSGTTFSAQMAGPTALIAIDEDGKAFDYMYVVVEPVTSLRLYRDGAEAGTAEIEEGDTLLLRGLVMSGTTYLRGTPAYDCTVTDDDDDPIPGEVSVDCATPGEIKLLAVSEGVTTLTVTTGGAEATIAIEVTPRTWDTDTDSDSELETDTDTFFDTDPMDGGIDTDPMDGGIDTETDFDMDAGLDTETDVETDTEVIWDTEPFDAGLDAGGDAGEMDAGDSEDPFDMDGGMDAGLGLEVHNV